MADHTATTTTPPTSSSTAAPHQFSEAFQCTIVPVREVPISPSHPSGLQWDRPCLCPKWQNLENETVDRIVINPIDGKRTEYKTIHQIGGCIDKLLPWILRSMAAQSQAGLNEAVGLRQDVQQLNNAMSAGLVQIGTAVRASYHMIDINAHQTRLIGADNSDFKGLSDD